MRCNLIASFFLLAACEASDPLEIGSETLETSDRGEVFESETSEDFPRETKDTLEPISKKTALTDAEEKGNHGGLEVEEDRKGDLWWLSLPWENSIKDVVYADDGTAYPLDYKGPSSKITKDTVATTREIHRQISLHFGIKDRGKKPPKLASFLSARSSVETSMNGNERPFDRRGTVHGLDLKANWRAGLRVRGDYVELGSEWALHRPELFLGYGQGGMISWFFLKHWDASADPRSLGDSVVSGITYRRSLKAAFDRAKSTRIRCTEWDDEGREKNLWFNGEKHRVGKPLLDEAAYDACLEDGGSEKECRSKSRKTYKWKPGDPQPENTVKISKVTWWYLKSASGGRPCPAWKGDTYYKKTRKRFSSRARRFGLDSESSVRASDLGSEPEGSQYDLWKDIWDATLESRGKPPVDWDSLLKYGEERNLGEET